MNLFKKAGWAGMILVLGFLGGMFSNCLISPKMALADNAEVLKAGQLFFIGPDGRNGGQVYMPDGSGAIISLNAADQTQRVQIGTYSGNGEKGLPLIGLSDNKGNLRLLLRLAGGNESPVLIFKDSRHRDRIVMGLALNDPAEEPFLAYFDKDGNKRMLMGSY